MKDTFVDKYATAPATRRTLNALLSENATLRLKGITLVKVDTEELAGTEALHTQIKEITFIPRGGMVPHKEGKSDLIKVDDLLVASPSMLAGFGAIAFSLNTITEVLGLGKLTGITAAAGAVDVPVLPDGSPLVDGDEYASVHDFAAYIQLVTNQISTVAMLFNRAADRLGLKRVTDRGIGVASHDLVLSDITDFEATPRPFDSNTLTTTPAVGMISDLQQNIAYIALRINAMIDYVNSVSVDPAKPAEAPKFTDVPAVSGTAAVGGTLTISEELTKSIVTGEPTPRLSVRWMRDGQLLGTENAWSYEITEADIGKKIAATVYAENIVGKAQSVTADSEIAIPVPVIADVPTVNGVAQVGSVLNVTDGVWTGIVGIPEFQYRWREQGQTVDLGTDAAFTITEELSGKVLVAGVRVRVEGGAWSEWATAVPTADVTRKPFVSQMGLITVDDPVAVGSNITIGTAPVLGGHPAPTDSTYAWSVGGQVGAYGAQAPYVIKEGDEGAAVVLMVRASNSAGSFEGPASDPLTITFA